MNKIIVYVEGPSDKASMAALLKPLIEEKRQQGVSIEFFPAVEGDRKAYIISKVPKKAVNIISENQHSVVVAMPDLYPRNKGISHDTFAELKSGILRNFDEALKARGVASDARMKERFKVFCFKYELEALVLAAKDALMGRLGIKKLDCTWKLPVEDQNHDRPPKTIIKELFEKCGKKYDGVVDGPVILGSCRYQEIADDCPQCLKPFVEFLEGQ